MKNLPLGSIYNPTGDPLFHMPYQLRIDALISGNSQRMHNEKYYKRHNNKPVEQIDADTGKRVNEFPSIANAAAQVGIAKSTLEIYVKSGKPIKGYVWKRKEKK